MSAKGTMSHEAWTLLRSRERGLILATVDLVDVLAAAYEGDPDADVEGATKRAREALGAYRLDKGMVRDMIREGGE